MNAEEKAKQLAEKYGTNAIAIVEEIMNCIDDKYLMGDYNYWFSIKEKLQNN